MAKRSDRPGTPSVHEKMVEDNYCQICEKYIIAGEEWETVQRTAGVIKVHTACKERADRMGYDYSK